MKSRFGVADLASSADRGGSPAGQTEGAGSRALSTCDDTKRKVSCACCVAQRAMERGQQGGRGEEQGERPSRRGKQAGEKSSEEAKMRQEAGGKKRGKEDGRVQGERGVWAWGARSLLEATDFLQRPCPWPIPPPGRLPWRTCTAPRFSRRGTRSTLLRCGFDRSSWWVAGDRQRTRPCRRAAGGRVRPSRGRGALPPVRWAAHFAHLRHGGEIACSAGCGLVEGSGGGGAGRAGLRCARSGPCWMRETKLSGPRGCASDRKALCHLAHVCRLLCRRADTATNHWCAPWASDTLPPPRSTQQGLQ